jgi:hypothetical protein
MQLPGNSYNHNPMKNVVLFALFSLLLGSLAACGGGDAAGSAPPGDPPARAVEAYLSAKVSRDADAVRAGLCSAMEADLERETRTFESVSNVAIENMSCASDDPAAESETVVRCSGEIVALYGLEETRFPLAAYRAVSEDGEWRWCGEGE